MGFPGEPPRRQPYAGPDSSPPGESWFDSTHDRPSEPSRPDRPGPSGPGSSGPGSSGPGSSVPGFPGSGSGSTYDGGLSQTYGRPRPDAGGPPSPGLPPSGPQGQPLPGGDPFGQPRSGTDPFGQPRSGTDPFGQPQTGADPYARPRSGTDPYGQPRGTDPFGQPRGGTDPFGQPATGADSSGQAQPGTDPYGQAQTGTYSRPDAFGQAQTGTYSRPDAFGQGTPTPGRPSDPFGQPSPGQPSSGQPSSFGQGPADPFGGPSQDPFGQPSPGAGQPYGSPPAEDPAANFAATGPFARITGTTPAPEGTGPSTRAPEGTGSFGRVTGSEGTGSFGRPTGPENGAPFGGGGPDGTGSFGAGTDKTSSFGAGPGSTGSFGAGPDGTGSFGAGAEKTSSFGAGADGTGSFGSGADKTGGFGAGPDDGPFGRGGGPQAAQSPEGAGPSGRRAAKQAGGTGPFARIDDDREESEGGELGFGLPEGKRRDGKKSEVPQERRSRDMWSPYDEGPRSYRPIYYAVAALLLLAAGGYGLTVMASWDSDTTATTEPAPSVGAPVAPAAPGGKEGFAASRKTDKYPLTLNELFARKKITTKDGSYEMTVRRSDKSCKNGATGDKLTKALSSAKCTQMLRASFRDKSGKIIGTVGVANLSNGSGATKVVEAAAGGKLEDYVKPLPGKDDVTKALGSGQANAGAWRFGHYAVLLWFQYKDGHAPSKAEQKKLTQAAVSITDVTVYPALESRALTGRRPG
ncbi:hypothetical protein Misp01_07340 [Microtetraspora sp. NBRC 13810]|uniref:hypothetical protein n=1 Tax=Microtetraspora sp. NBRC 13810 TaxID=3030990 RepID=UPI0024A00747|nr:hypothetical protein [Microtetraspora sp. NBRC 13810]GLW05604.1 hypothetical protein Misp01_07340 [Microtetraspora sp. NBRC 13810]